jgi:hypothetical protein
VGADAGAAELRVDRAAIGLAGGGPTPGQDPATVPFAVASARLIAFVRCGSLGGLRSGQYIVRRQRPPDPLQLELTDRLDLHGVLDLHQHSRTDEDLSGLRLIAQSRGNVRHGPDSGVVEPAFKADSAERSEAVRYADAEANLMPKAAPRVVKAPMASRTSSAMSTAWSAGFSTGTGSLKITITPSPA